MAPDFTKAELLEICGWALAASDKAKKFLPHWPDPYEKARAIHEKAHQEYMKMEREG